MADMTAVRHFKTGRLGFVIRTNGDYAWIFFPDVNRADWRRASAFIRIPDEEVQTPQYQGWDVL